MKSSVGIISVLFLTAFFFVPEIHPDSVNLPDSPDLLKVYQKLRSGTHGMNQLSDQPLFINSRINGQKVSSVIISETEIPYSRISTEITDSAVWCEIAMLHLNIKSCIHRSSQITFFAGRKYYQSPDKASRFPYSFRVLQHSPEITSVSLYSEEGPGGTSDHRMDFEAVPYKKGTIIRFSLSFRGSAVSGRIADLYFVTLGSEKQGFTYSEYSGRKRFTGGVQGALERNSMRYYLAMVVHFQTRNGVSALEKASLWYDYTERYRKQLHEVEKNEYLDAKEKEFLNQSRMQNKAAESEKIYLSSD